MQTAILNCSLDEKVCPGYPVDQRFRTVMASMRLCFRDVVGEIKSVDYDGPDGHTREDCAVVTVGFEASKQAFEDAVRYLACQLGQDCIAVMHPDGTGKTLGPRADRWPFDPKFFNLPSVCQLHQEAA